MKKSKISHKKKIILTIIVLTETIIGSLAGYSYYQQKIEQKKVFRAIKVSRIDKTKVILDKTKRLKYYYELDPNKRWEEQPEWLGYKVHYQTNNDGLRETKDYSIDKPKNTFRIITLGDSFTYGHHVDTDQNWTELLENKLNSIDCGYSKIEVINLGMPGYDIQYIVERYKKFGVKYQPDLILWFESRTGFTRLTELTEPLVNACYNKETKEEKDKDKNKYYKRAKCGQKADAEINALYSYQERTTILENFLNAFYQMPYTNKTTYFTYLEMSDDDNLTFAKWKDKYKQATFIKLVPGPIETEMLPDGHPNPKGHKTIANHIFTYLIKQNILKCHNK